MKCFKGTPLNISNSVLGKISKNARQKWFLKSNQPLIYVGLAKEDKLPKVAGYILDGLPEKSNKIGSTPVIYGLSKSDIDELNQDDIVLLEKDGNINVLYEVDSQQNAIFATNRCSLRCIMCPQPPQSVEDSKLETNLSIIRMMNSDKTTNLAITGGEPTLLGEGFFKLVRTIKELLPSTSLVILTNGKRFKDIEFARSVALIGHPLITIAIPLYSDDEQNHDEIVGVPGSFLDVIKGLHNLALFKFRIEIRTVIHALNYERIPKLIEFIYRNLPFVSHVAMMGLEVTGLARENADRLWIDPHEYILQLEQASEYLCRYNMRFSIYNHQLCVLPQKLWKFCRMSISQWKNIYVKECEKCSVKLKCGGFFETSENYRSRFIRSIQC